MIDTIWTQEFRRIHWRAFCVYLVEVLIFAVYAAFFAAEFKEEEYQTIVQLKNTPRGIVRLTMGATLLLFPATAIVVGLCLRRLCCPGAYLRRSGGVLV